MEKLFFGLKFSFLFHSYVLESKDNISGGIYGPKDKYKKWQVEKNVSM